MDGATMRGGEGAKNHIWLSAARKAGQSEFAAKREQLALLAAKRDLFLSKVPRISSLADLFLSNYTLWL